MRPILSCVVLLAAGSQAAAAGEVPVEPKPILVEVVGRKASADKIARCQDVVRRLGGNGDETAPVHVVLVHHASTYLVVTSRTRGIVENRKLDARAPWDALCEAALRAGEAALQGESEASVEDPLSEREQRFAARSLLMLDDNLALHGTIEPALLDRDGILRETGHFELLRRRSLSQARTGLNVVGSVVFGVSGAVGFNLLWAYLVNELFNNDNFAVETGLSVSLGGMIAGAAVLIGAACIPRLAPLEREPADVIRAHNAELRFELGLPPLLPTPRSDLLRPRFAPTFGAQGGGISMTMAF